MNKNPALAGKIAMVRVVTYFVIGLVGGFAVLLGLVVVSTEPGHDEYGVFAVLALLGALPVSSAGAVLGAVQCIQGELRETRREMKSMQASK